MKQQEISVEIYKVTIHQSKIAATFTSSNNELLENNYKKYQEFLHNTAKDIFINNLLNIHSYRYSEQERIVIKYVQAQALAFDLKLSLPESEKQSNIFKF